MNLPQLLTHSRLQSFRDCPRKHYYAYEAGLRRDTEAKPLRMGGAVHAGLDARCQGRGQDDAIAAATAGYEVMPQWAQASPDALHEWMTERATVACLLAGYFWYWRCTDEHPLGGWGGAALRVVASEQEFALPIRNPETGGTTQSFHFGGKFDKVVAWGVGAGDGAANLAVMEHKTCSESIEPDSDYWRRLHLDAQISGYVHGARSVGFPVTTVLYDVIRKPTIEPRLVPVTDDAGLKIVTDSATGERVFKANGEPRQSPDAARGWVCAQRRESPDEYQHRLMNDIASRPEWYFQRVEIPRLESDMEDFHADLWQQQQAVREAQRLGRWYRNAARCTKPYRCEYLDICRRGYRAGEPVPAGFRVVENVHEELASGAGSAGEESGVA